MNASIKIIPVQLTQKVSAFQQAQRTPEQRHQANQLDHEGLKAGERCLADAFNAGYAIVAVAPVESMGGSYLIYTLSKMTVDMGEKIARNLMPSYLQKMEN